MPPGGLRGTHIPGCHQYLLLDLHRAWATQCLVLQSPVHSSRAKAGGRGAQWVSLDELKEAGTDPRREGIPTPTRRSETCCPAPGFSHCQGGTVSTQMCPNLTVQSPLCSRLQFPSTPCCPTVLCPLLRPGYPTSSTVPVGKLAPT